MIGKPTKPPIMAVPDFTVLTADADTQAAAKTLTAVLRADLAFEREFDVMPPANFAGVRRRRRSRSAVRRWTACGATTSRSAGAEAPDGTTSVEVRVVSVKEPRQRSASARAASAVSRRIAHYFSDEIHPKSGRSRASR
jgi:hypothetical protein